jgi:iron complex transport system ATP-binding protein
MFIREGGTVILVTHHVHEIPPEVGRGVLLKYCRIIEDSFTGEVLHSRELSVLFDTPVHLFRRHGWFHVMPAGDS